MTKEGLPKSPDGPEAVQGVGTFTDSEAAGVALSADSSASVEEKPQRRGALLYGEVQQIYIDRSIRFNAEGQVERVE